MWLGWVFVEFSFWWLLDPDRSKRTGFWRKVTWPAAFSPVLEASPSISQFSFSIPSLTAPWSFSHWQSSLRLLRFRCSRRWTWAPMTLRPRPRRSVGACVVFFSLHALESGSRMMQQPGFCYGLRKAMRFRASKSLQMHGGRCFKFCTFYLHCCKCSRWCYC